MSLRDCLMTTEALIRAESNHGQAASFKSRIPRHRRTLFMEYDEPWENMLPAKKVNVLRKQLETFIAFYNDAVLKRNERLDAMGEAIKRIESRLDALERKNA
jgi:hypothetical protein